MNLKNNLKISQAMLNISKTALCATLVSATLLIQGCGGNGAGAAGAGSSTPTGSSSSSTNAATLSAKSVILLTNQPNLASDGKTTATITVLVKDDGNRALAGAVVDLTSTDPGVVIQQASTKTGADGSITATLTSTAKTNRIIPLKATVGVNTATLDIPVSGTTVTLNGPLSLPFGGSGDFTVIAKDSAGNPVANADVVLKSTAGNTFSPATVKTNTNGQASTKVTIAKSGADTITADAAGGSGSVKLTIASTLLSFTGVTAAEDVIVNTVKTVGILLTENGAPVVSKVLSVNATRGSISIAGGGKTVTTDSAGRATFSVSSSDAGPSTLTVSDAAATIVTTTPIAFISTTPSAVKIQAAPATVAANAIGASGNSSQLLASVKDVSGNPVKGVMVNFSAVADPSHGRIEPSSAVTDSAGNATVAFISGPDVTGPDQVVLQASVNGTTIPNSSATLTVASRQVSIRLGTGNKIEVDSITKYKFPWTAVIVDSAGSPISGALVTVQVVPIGYYKGSWVKSGKFWVSGAFQTQPNGTETVPLTIVNEQFCPSEDFIRADGNLQVGEDLNSNGKLDPGGVATTDVPPTGKVTGANGFVDFNVLYAKSFSQFTKVRIDVRAQVSGTESVVSETFILPMEATDAQADAPPTIPGSLSGPFGKIVSDQSSEILPTGAVNVFPASLKACQNYR
jgi:Bacterial Ig-like domain (group 1)